jgi:hypothetical protein
MSFFGGSLLQITGPRVSGNVWQLSFLIPGDAAVLSRFSSNMGAGEAMGLCNTCTVSLCWEYERYLGIYYDYDFLSIQKISIHHAPKLSIGSS